MLYKLIACSLAALLCLTGCASGAAPAPPVPADSVSPSSAVSAPPSTASASTAPSSTPDDGPLTPEEAETMRRQLMSENGDLFGGLTVAQMEQDFDFLWNTVQTSYPFLGVAKRQGIDPEALYQKYRAALPKYDNDILFMNLVRDFVREFQGLGHFHFFMESREYLEYRELYKTLTDSPHCKIIYDRMMNPVTVKSYDSLEAMSQKIFAILARVRPAPSQQQLPDSQSPAPSNITASILTPGKTAYLKISSFGAQYVETDRDSLLSFYKEAAGCENLIIDITGNGGGSDGYWTGNIVWPNLAKSMTGTSYILYADTPEISAYLKSDHLFDNSRPIAELPKLPRLVAEDAEGLARFESLETKLSPSGKQLFPGKIWLLVDNRVYSSSESFAMFCKETGFATIVGTPTGGDGGGIDPLFFSLPNSGLGWRFSVLYSVNSDGSNSEEFGTTPDILSPQGESPLDTCLKQIG